MDNEQVLAPVGAKGKLTESLPAKIAAFILLVVFAAMAVLSVLGICLIVADNYYSRSADDLKDELLGTFVRKDAINICQDIDRLGSSGYTPEITLGNTNLTCQIYGPAGQSYDNHNTSSPFYVYDVGECYVKYDANDARTDYSARIYINKAFPVTDKYSITADVVDTLLTLRYWIYPLTLIFIGCCIALFIFLMKATGHKKGQAEISGSFITKIPFDLLVTSIAIVTYLAFQGLWELSYSIDSIVFNLAFFGLMIGCCFCLFTGLCISFATRVKMGTWWRNNLIVMVCRLVWRILKAVVLGICRAIGYALRRLPLIWKTVLGLIVLGILGLFCVVFDDTASRLTMLFFVGLVVAAYVIYVALVLRKLQYAGRKIAAGDLCYHVDTSKMLWDLKEHGENLNSISLGMTKAVDERMKSERLKTELITNVSHDIKTPLTSIINYVDLISKEESGNEKIDEYAAVLARQSERLKKLIEDLVEASKATTGNVEVSLAPCDAGVLASQTAGEYAEKLSQSALSAIVTAPEAPLMIMADGRLLWRVFDNLMNNVCKYAQPDTRVYISAEKNGGDVLISLKNISKYPLNIKSDELLERFVRGDSSRSTEGSGLGLSIAKSLTELMGGAFELTIDGDLFKAALRFKSIS